jgi:hypothetical protein
LSCYSGFKRTKPRFKEETHVPGHHHRRSPPRPSAPLALDQLWNRLTNEQRQQTLATLSNIVVRQLGTPRDEQEVRDERR